VLFVPKLREQPTLYAASFLYVLGTALFPVWLFQGLERIKIAAFALGIARMMTVPALFIFVHSEHDCVVAAAIQASVQVTATIFVLPILLTQMQLHWYRPSFNDIVQTFKGGWPLFISGCALYLSTSSTTVVLGFVGGKAEVGYYSAADKLIKAAASMLSPITQALYPHITALKTASRASALQLIQKSFVSTGILSLCASIATVLFAAPICRLFLGPSFNESIYVLQWLSPLPLLFGLMSVFGTQTMLVFEMDSAMSRIMFTSATAGIPLILILSRAFGARGAAAGSTALAFAMVVAMVAILRLRGLTVWHLSLPEASSA
jgi:O-antigen/teichoic acid export membrane protein